MNINIIANKKSLCQARSNGILMNVLKFDEQLNAFQNITDTFYCKDYLMDFLVEEKYGKSEPVYGFKHTKVGVLENEEYLYMGLGTEKCSQCLPGVYKDPSTHFNNLRAFLKLVDVLYTPLLDTPGKVSEVIDTDKSDWKIIKVPIEYTKLFYLFGLYTLFLRLGMAYENQELSLIDYLKNIKSSNLYSEDISNVRSSLFHIIAFSLGYIDYTPDPYVEDYVKGIKNNMSMVHNYAGFVSHTANCTTLPYKFLLLYGSLREGMYNYKGFKEDYGDEFYKVNLDTPVYINYMKMYSLGSYPYIVKSHNVKDKIVVEPFIVSDKCYNSIRGMELGAGYDEVPTSFVLNNSGMTMNIYSKKVAGNHTVVENGDWVNFVNKKQLV